MQAMHAKAGPSRAAPMSRRASVRVHAAKPVVMVNSCTGKMGKAVADAAVRAGLTLAPYTLCSEGEAGGNVEVAGQQLQLVGPSTRDKVIEQVGVVAACQRLSSAVTGTWQSTRVCFPTTQPSMQPRVTLGSRHFRAACLFHTYTPAGEAAAPQPHHGRLHRP